MANAILNSNSSSALISSLDSVSSNKNPYIYSYAQKGTLGAAHVPAHSRTVVVSQPTGTPNFGTNIDFPVIKADMLSNAFIKLVLENNTGADAYANQGLLNMMVEEISLLTAGKVICSSRPFGRAALMSNKPYQVKKNLELMYNLTNGRQAIPHAAGTNFVTAYIPLGFSCFDAPELNYNTSFVEPLLVRVRLAAANAYLDDNAGNAVNAAQVGIRTVELIQVHRSLPADKLQKQISSNYSDTESLVRVQPYDLVEENSTKPLAAAADQVIEHTLTTNRVMTKLFIAVENTVSQVANSIASFGEGAYLPIKNIKISGNGQNIIDCDGDLVRYALNADSDSSNSAFAVGNNWDASFPHNSNIYCFDLGFNKDPSHMTNALSTREISDFKVTCTLTAASATLHRLRVCLCSPFLESINSASGKISTSLSS